MSPCCEATKARSVTSKLGARQGARLPLHSSLGARLYLHSSPRLFTLHQGSSLFTLHSSLFNKVFNKVFKKLFKKVFKKVFKKLFKKVFKKVFTEAFHRRSSPSTTSVRTQGNTLHVLLDGEGCCGAQLLSFISFTSDGLFSPYHSVLLPVAFLPFCLRLSAVNAPPHFYDWALAPMTTPCFGTYMLLSPTIGLSHLSSSIGCYCYRLTQAVSVFFRTPTFLSLSIPAFDKGLHFWTCAPLVSSPIDPRNRPT
jgi:hypothetical protein